MKKWSGFFVFGLFVSPAIWAQTADTSRQLPLVQVEEHRHPAERQPALQRQSPDTLLLRALPAASVADWLQWQGSASLRSYGPNGLATLSIRGSSAQQHTVLWEGLPLLNPMNGTPDLNLYPMWLLGGVSVQTGSSASDFGSGAIGGALHFRQGIPQKHDAAVFTEMRSFGDYAGGVAASVRARKGWYQLRGLYRTAQNNFPYTNMARFGNPEERLAHAAHAQGGILQEAGWQFHPNWRLRAAWWMQAHRRELPASMTEQQSTAVQADTAHRFAVSLTGQAGRWQLAFRQGFLREVNHFADERLGFDERHRFNALLQEISAATTLGRHEFSQLLQQAYYTANSPNFSGQERQYRLALVPGWRLNGAKTTARVQLRVEMVDGQLVPLTPSLQVEQRLAPALQMRLAASRTYRLPGFNDLYWQPGGNADLQPENGWQAETGLGWKKQGGSWAFSVDGGAFWSDLTDWIIWLPNTSLGYWMPRNLRRVQSMGWEQQWGVSKQWRGLKLRLNGDYAYVATTHREVGAGEQELLGKQLIYIPKHQFRGRFFVEHASFFAGWQYSYNGLRFTSSDNRFFLPNQHLHQIMLGGSKAWGKQLLRLTGTIHNAFNLQYQQIAWRPMPGRHYQITLQINFNAS